MQPNLKVICWAGALTLLLLLPAPLLPPHLLVKAVGKALQLRSASAYLVAAVGMQFAFYFVIGILAALAINRATSLRRRLVQISVLPLAVVGVALLIRSIKAGHLPNYANVAVPFVGAVLGSALGLGLLYQRLKRVGVVLIVILAIFAAALFSRNSSSLKHETEVRLRAVVAVGANLPKGDARFGALLEAAFRPLAKEEVSRSAVEQNRASILAWAIAVGHTRVATLVGLDVRDDLVIRAAALSQGTTLRGRPDWSRHYAVSAALTVLGHAVGKQCGGPDERAARRPDAGQRIFIR